MRNCPVAAQLHGANKIMQEVYFCLKIGPIMMLGAKLMKGILDYLVIYLAY